MTDHIAEFNFWSSRCSQYLNWWLSFSLFNFHIDKSQNLFSAFLACAHGPLLSSPGKFHNPRSLYFRALYARRNAYRYLFSYLGTLNVAVWPSKGRNAQWIAVESRDPNSFDGERESREDSREPMAGLPLSLWKSVGRVSVSGNEHFSKPSLEWGNPVHVAMPSTIVAIFDNLLFFDESFDCWQYIL
jgi:hypothetical protein